MSLHTPRRSQRNINKPKIRYSRNFLVDEDSDENDEPPTRCKKVKPSNDDHHETVSNNSEMLSTTHHDSNNNSREASTTESINLDQDTNTDHELFEPLEQQLTKPVIMENEMMETTITSEQQKQMTSGITIRKPSVMENLLDKPINYRLEIISQLLSSLQNDYEQAEQNAVSMSDVIKRATFTIEELDKLDKEKLNQLRKVLQNSANIATEILLERK
ncbi:predicted protein [Naegleria gruberi]|uniref:Predicted protein n=1 Tax=Naegleria gruberi TaxID=5762 RepID=D2VHA4_NAEGR|nr:uncharacterized protein NAEGRDRAFT_49450 [Naegleria gruberi]EFC43766.1 predicted protein [Naegleria gruberi]|eukprot:XP_002676510.1 predicted protein [Naegleria gruberi strain NEG-M]